MFKTCGIDYFNSIYYDINYLFYILEFMNISKELFSI